MEGPRENAARLLEVAEQLNDRMRALVDKETQVGSLACDVEGRKIYALFNYSTKGMRAQPGPRNVAALHGKSIKKPRGIFVLIR